MNPYRRETDLVGSKTILTGMLDAETASGFLANYRGGTIFLSSCGGDIGAMLVIFDHIKTFEDTVIVATGVCQSAAAVLLQAAQTRIMSRNAVLQFIPPPENRDVDEPRWFLHSNLVNLVRERTGMALPESYDLFDSQMLNAERALQLGLIDKIEGREDDYVAPEEWNDYRFSGSEEQAPESSPEGGVDGQQPE